MLKILLLCCLLFQIAVPDNLMTMKPYLMLFIGITVLLVDKPISSLQCDLETSGTVHSTISIDKQLVSIRMPNGHLRVIIYGINRLVFSGKFAEIDAAVLGISGIIGSTQDAMDAKAVVTALGSPSQLRINK